MWFAPFFARFLPGWALNAALVIHSEEGLLAILFIFSIHFVNTHLRPGQLSHGHGDLHRRGERKEFKHKRPQEYARMVREGKLEERLAKRLRRGSVRLPAWSDLLRSSSESRC